LILPLPLDFVPLSPPWLLFSLVERCFFPPCYFRGLVLVLSPLPFVAPFFSVLQTAWALFPTVFPPYALLLFFELGVFLWPPVKGTLWRVLPLLTWSPPLPGFFRGFFFFPLFDFFSQLLFFWIVSVLLSLSLGGKDPLLGGCFP